MRRFFYAAALLTLAFFGQSCAKKQNYTKLEGEIFHTFYSIKYDQGTDYSAAVDSTFRVFSHALNPFDSTSLIAAINRGESTHTDAMLREVWQESVRISQATQGSYDVTCSPLINMWGFGFERPADSVSPQLIDSLRQLVGYQKVQLKGEEMIKADRRMKMDFSSISKGYCSDLVARTLATKGCKSYLVELGGEIAYKGRNSRGEDWVVGINKPVEDSTGVVNDLYLRLRLPKHLAGLATSGNYRNYKEVDGKRFAHTIDPKTGYPIQTDVLSATIIASSCMLADGLATACMTKRSSEVPALLAHFPGVEYMLILADNKEGFRSVMSEGFKTLVIDEE